MGEKSASALIYRDDERRVGIRSMTVPGRPGIAEL